MRILITVPSLAREFGGPSAKAHQLAAALRAPGDDVIVAGAGVGDDDRTLGLPVAGRFHATPIPSSTRAIRRLVGRADVVHVIGLRDPVGSAAASAAVRAGVPYVLEPVGMHARRLRSVRLKAAFDRLIGDRVVRRAGAVVATSRLESDELLEAGVASGSIRVRPNGIDVDDLLPLPSRGAFRAANGIPADAPLILALGRVTAKKGLPALVEAVAALPEAWLVVVGPEDGDGTRHHVLAAAAGAGAADRVVLAGPVWGRDRAGVFADADAFALPSATENFGNAAAEAAAVGLPVVVSDRCGVAEYLPSGSSFVVAFGEPSALRRAVTDALDPDARASGEAHAPEVRRTLSWAGIAQMQREIYRELHGAGAASHHVR